MGWSAPWRRAPGPQPKGVPERLNGIELKGEGLASTSRPAPLMDGWFASHLNQGRKPMQALIIHAYAAPTLNLAFTANPAAEGIVSTSIHLARRTTIFRGG